MSVASGSGETSREANAMGYTELRGLEGPSRLKGSTHGCSHKRKAGTRWVVTEDTGLERTRGGRGKASVVMELLVRQASMGTA